MSDLKILKYPDPLLKQACAPVAEFNGALHKLLDDMREAMYLYDGIGLAAPQVGELKRLLILDISPERNKPMEFINPVITWEEGTDSAEEGCLSIPDYREIIKRSKKVRVTAQDRAGKSFEMEADELLARCIQHEMDHLDGVLFIDRASRLKKHLFQNWFKKRGSFE